MSQLAEEAEKHKKEGKKVIATVEKKGKQIVVTPVEEEVQTEEDKIKNEEKLGKHLLVEG